MLALNRGKLAPELGDAVANAPAIELESRVAGAAQVLALLAARRLAEQPEAMQLRYLQTLGSIAGERSSTIVLPLPMELLSGVARPRG